MSVSEYESEIENNANITAENYAQMFWGVNPSGSNSIGQSNNNSIETVVQGANGTTANLNNVNVGLLSNINQEILVKKDELIKLQNNDLTSQLRNLDAIQSNIENKNVIIDQINYNMQLQQNNIMILIVSILFGIVLLGTLFSYGYGYIQYSIYIYIIIYLVVAYILFIIYQYNIFYIKSAILAIFNGNLPQRINNSVSNIQSYAINQIEEDLYGSESKWLETNCKCPPGQTGATGGTFNNEQSMFEEEPGLFYYDSSAPPQLLLSNPQPPNYLPMSQTPNSSSLESINWVDYDSTQQNYSTNYYNYNNNYTDPSNTLTNELNNANIYVASETWTTNL
jgi:hypothetical protein